MPPLVVDMMERWRADLLRGERTTQIAMARRWLQVEQALLGQVQALAAEYQRNGEQPTLWTLVRSRRYQELMRQARAEMQRYVQFADQATMERQRQMVEQAAQQVPALIQASVSPEAAVSLQFDRMPVGAVQNMVGLASNGSPLRDVLLDASRVGPEALGQQLVSGLALGWNPEKIARAAMRLGMGRSFTRMATIARTETLRAYRQATLEGYRTSGIVVGYRRVAAKSTRTCLGCLMQDGQFYQLDQPFDQHPNCRCTLVPVVRDHEQAPAWTLGPDWLENQPEDIQRQMMGPARFRLWREGRISLADMATRVDDPTWGGAWQPTAVSELAAMAS